MEKVTMKINFKQMDLLNKLPYMKIFLEIQLMKFNTIIKTEKINYI